VEVPFLYRVEMKARLQNLPRKLQAPLAPTVRPARHWKHAAWSLVSSILGLTAITVLAHVVHSKLLIGSLGASAVLLFGAPDSPLAQPRNLIGGHFLSAIVGVGVVMLGGSSEIWMSVAVGLSILLMYLTHTLHPPGGATALIAVHDQVDWSFPFMPVALGAFVLLGVALLTNNIVHHRQYPKHWW